MKKKYYVNAGLPGCMPDNQNVYETKTAAIWGMKDELSSWADAWKYQYDPKKGTEVKNPYWKVSGSARKGFYQIRLGKHHFVNISMYEDDVYNENGEN